MFATTSTMRITYAFIVVAAIAPVVLAADPASAPKVVTLSVDQDLVVLIKGAIWVGGIFLAAFAFIGIAFFGWDVRKARTSLLDAQEETRKLLKELKDDFVAMKELKEKLEQLGAQLEEGGVASTKEAPVSKTDGRSDLDLIREVIASSNYKWATIGRLINRTGLSRESILEEVRKASDIQIGTGRKTQDFIFKFKKDS